MTKFRAIAEMQRNSDEVRGSTWGDGTVIHHRAPATGS